MCFLPLAHPIIKILTGLEKRVENISETVSTQIRNNIAETKDLVNAMRNTPAGMNIRLEEAEEKINRT